MGDRASFLRAWFSALEDRGVSWACLRNATEVFGPGPSDVDLLVAQRHQRNFLATLEEVADRQKARLLQDTRFASASRVYRPTEGSPFRIDFEHQLAWRGFPVLPADALLARRQRQEIWVLDPTDELAVLILTAVWRGQLSPRYRARILALRAQTRDPGKIAGILRQAFGAAGPKIEEALARLTRGEDASLPLGEIRAALMRRALGNPRHTVPWIKNLAGDIFRFGERWRHPPGPGARLACRDDPKPPRALGGGRRKALLPFSPGKMVLAAGRSRGPLFGLQGGGFSNGFSGRSGGSGFRFNHHVRKTSPDMRGLRSG